MDQLGLGEVPAGERSTGVTHIQEELGWVEGKDSDHSVGGAEVCSTD